MINQIEFTRVNNDTNGNPRFVCSYHNLLTKEEKGYHNGKEYIEPTIKRDNQYSAALKRAKTLGGSKFHNKQYGGGIVFQSYNIGFTEKSILEATGEARIPQYKLKTYSFDEIEQTLLKLFCDSQVETIKEKFATQYGK